jgi:hypothetical protein
MALLDPIDIGIVPNDGTGDPLRDAFDKVNQNDQLLNDDIGQNTNDITDLQDEKANRANPSTAGNIAELDASGNVIDSGNAVSDILINPVDAIEFNTAPPTLTDEGTILWNENEYTIDINTGLGATIQVGQETLLLYYNDTGSLIPNGAILHPKGATVVSGFIIPTPELADASKWELSEGTLSVATHNIANGAIGFATRFGRVRGINTSGASPGSQIWLSETTPGQFTATKPIFPNHSISIGGALNSDASNGEIFVSITGEVGDTFNESWDGAIRETFDFLVTSNGTTVIGTLSNVNPLLNLTLFFSDVKFYTLDTTTSSLTVELTAGTDVLPATNYVYIPINTKVLTVSSSGFPTTEHCKIARLEVQSAVTVQTEGGAVRNQNINDHIKSEDNNGHILHIAERIRQLNAEHDNGTEASLTGTPTNGYIQVTSGQVWQMHKQVFQSFSMPTDNIIISNDFTTANRRTNNLNTITAYSDGSAWNNEWSKVVVWGVANKSGEPDFVFINLPSAGYSSEPSAVSDSLNYSDYTIPNNYKGVGFLIAAFTIRISGGTITYNGGTSYQDLRGFIPNNIAGGGGGSGVTSLLGLTDTPSSYSGEGGKILSVNSAENGVIFTDALITQGSQVAPGSEIVTFSTTPTFDFDNGNVQQLTLTGNLTSWTISNDLPAGAYTIFLIQDATGGWTIPDPTGIDAETDNSITAFVTAINAVNVVNIFVRPDGVSYWALVETITP